MGKLHYASSGQRFSLSANEWNELAALVNRKQPVPIPESSVNVPNKNVTIRVTTNIKGPIPAYSLCYVSENAPSQSVADTVVLVKPCNDFPNLHERSNLCVIQENLETWNVVRAVVIGITPVRATIPADGRFYFAKPGYGGIINATLEENPIRVMPHTSFEDEDGNKYVHAVLGSNFLTNEDKDRSRIFDVIITSEIPAIGDIPATPSKVILCDSTDGGQNPDAGMVKVGGNYISVPRTEWERLPTTASVWLDVIMSETGDVEIQVNYSVMPTSIGELERRYFIEIAKVVNGNSTATKLIPGETYVIRDVWT